MTGKILIVEDEPIVALDLQQEIEQFGLEVVGLAESADEALIAVEENLPDMALMDIRIVGSMDGIQTARLLRHAYQVPVIFLTSYSDETTISRASREMPYGYLTKPFQTRELKATLSVALHKAKKDAAQRAAQQAIAATVHCMREGILMISLDYTVQFMNAAAEELSGWKLGRAKGMHLTEVLDLKDNLQQPVPVLTERDPAAAVEEFGWSLNPFGGGSAVVDFSIAPMIDNAGRRRGFVVTVRSAAERLRTQAIEETAGEFSFFDQAPMGMVQLDAEGHVVRVNEALLRESGVSMESLVGRSLTGLRMDPDPRIAKDLMHKLLQGETSVAPLRPQITN